MEWGASPWFPSDTVLLPTLVSGHRFGLLDGAGTSLHMFLLEMTPTNLYSEL
jgi:hypothetical protein